MPHRCRRFDAVSLDVVRDRLNGAAPRPGRWASAIAVVLVFLTSPEHGWIEAAEPDLMQTLVTEDVTLNNSLIPLDG